MLISKLLANHYLRLFQHNCKHKHDLNLIDWSITKGGILNLEISSSKETFESDGGDTGVAARIQERVTKGQYKRSFDIPPGTYTVKLHSDENENGELDTNVLGIPKEQYGISNNSLFLNFEAASFAIDTYKKIQIDL